MKLINTQKVKDLLIEKGLKNIDLANHLGVPPSSISAAISSKRNISMNYIFDLAEFFDVEPKSLTYENDTKKHSTTPIQKAS